VTAWIQGDSTLWLNLTNATLGLTVLGCVALMIWAGVSDALQERRKRTALSKELDEDLRRLVEEYEAEGAGIELPGYGTAQEGPPGPADRYRS
jgi:hypothetical protein